MQAGYLMVETGPLLMLRHACGTNCHRNFVPAKVSLLSRGPENIPVHSTGHSDCVLITISGYGHLKSLMIDTRFDSTTRTDVYVVGAAARGPYVCIRKMS
jgi:hypothetical protein